MFDRASKVGQGVGKLHGVKTGEASDVPRSKEAGIRLARSQGSSVIHQGAY